MIVYQTTLSMLEYHSTVTMCLLLMELIGKQNSVPENYFNDLHGPVQPKLALDDMLGSRTTHYIVYHYHTPPSLMVQQQRNLELANNHALYLLSMLVFMCIIPAHPATVRPAQSAFIPATLRTPRVSTSIGR